MPTRPKECLTKYPHEDERSSMKVLKLLSSILRVRVLDSSALKMFCAYFEKLLSESRTWIR